MTARSGRVSTSQTLLLPGAAQEPVPHCFPPPSPHRAACQGLPLPLLLPHFFLLHLPDKLLSFKSSSQHLIQGKHKLKYIWPLCPPFSLPRIFHLSVSIASCHSGPSLTANSLISPIVISVHYASFIDLSDWKSSSLYISLLGNDVSLTRY